MTDIEVTKHAKMYIDQLAKGIDPISGNAVPDDSVLSQERLVKCFQFVSVKLDEVIEAEEYKHRPKSTKRFAITTEDIQRVPLSDEPISVNPFCEIITNTVNNPNIKPLGGTIVTEWLEAQGYLQSIQKERGGIKRVPTEKGNEIGIAIEDGKDIYAKSANTYYNRQAQEFILLHLQEMLRK